MWRLTLEDGSEAQARVLVNAGGPFVSQILSSVLGHNTVTPIRLVKGSHIVVPRLYAHDRCYIFQNADGRVCFAIPYHDDFTLIGTTDEDYTGDPAAVTPSAEEERYLCAAVSEYFRATGRSGLDRLALCRRAHRCATTARARRRRPRATTCWNCRRSPARLPSCRCSAAS